jgi:hypothetical protein
MRFVRQPTEKEMHIKRENLAIALCEFGEYAKWFNDNVEEIPFTGSMDRPITDCYKYDENGYVVRYPNSDDIIAYTVFEAARIIDELELKHYGEYEVNHWYDYLSVSYASLWRHLDI